jgi:hypothetical protein
VRVYRLPLVSTAVSAAIDLCEINPATSQMLKLLQVRFGQVGTTDVGDAQEEIREVKLITGYTTSGSGGNSSVTAVGDPGDPTFGGTCETFNTTQANTGTTTTFNLGTWNVRTEFLWIPPPTPNEPIPGIWIPYNTRAVITLPAPADALQIIGEVIFGTVGAA